MLLSKPETDGLMSSIDYNDYVDDILEIRHVQFEDFRVHIPQQKQKVEGL